jgi:hypothetical protein
MVGVAAGQHLLRPGNHRRPAEPGPVPAFTAWDGNWYREVATGGYTHNPTGPSRLAFFPLYPLLGGALARASGLDPAAALLLVSHLSLAAAFAVTALYVRQRYPAGPPALADHVLLALGLFPPTLFCRMAYSEALFLLLVVLTLYGLERRWPLAVLAALVGLATAARIPGVGLLAPLGLHVWRSAPALRGRVLRLALLLPLACWGLAAYMLYQWLAFGTPLGFVEAQQRWGMRPAVSTGEKVLDLLALEPVSAVLDPDSPGYWGQREDAGLGPLCYGLVEPFLFLAAAVLLLVGAGKRWLSSYELLCGAALLLIPYAGRAHEMCMVSSARFASVVFPVYLVLGNLLARARPAWAVSYYALCGVLLALYSALFTAWYRVF